MNQFPQDAFVRAEAIGRVKTAKAAAAESAAAFGIQRETILEWRPATDAEKFGAERLGRFQARPANRDAAISRKGSPQTRQSSGKKREKRA